MRTGYKPDDPDLRPKTKLVVVVFVAAVVVVAVVIVVVVIVKINECLPLRTLVPRVSSTGSTPSGSPTSATGASAGSSRLRFIGPFKHYTLVLRNVPRTWALTTIKSMYDEESSYIEWTKKTV